MGRKRNCIFPANLPEASPTETVGLQFERDHQIEVTAATEGITYADMQSVLPPEPERIASLAYEMWEQRGYPEGRLKMTGSAPKSNVYRGVDRLR